MSDKNKKKKRARMDVSLNEIQDLLWQKLQEEKGDDAYLTAVYPGYLIYEKGGKHYRCGWSLMDGEVVVSSEDTEVEKQWVEARSAQDMTEGSAQIVMRLGAAADPEGSSWEVLIAEPGAALNGWHFTEEVLRAAADKFEGIDVNLYDLPGKGATHVDAQFFAAKKNLVKQKSGWLENVRYAASEGLLGVIHFLDSTKWIGKNLLEAAKQGVKPYGLSMDAVTRAVMDTIDGKRVMRATEIVSADSVDIVTRPAAGGKFIRAVAAQNNPASPEGYAATSKEGIMDRDKWLKLIKDQRPKLLEGKDTETITDDEIFELARMAMAQEPAKPGDNSAGEGAAPASSSTAPENAATKEDLALFRCELSLDRVIEASNLPDKSKRRVRKQFEGTVFEMEDLRSCMADEQDFLAAVEDSARKDMPVSASSVHVGIGTLDRARMAVDKTFGLTGEDMKGFAALARLDNQPFFDDMRLSRQDLEGFDDVPAFSGLRDMYTFFSGDKEVTGHFNRKNLLPELRASMSINSSTFTYLLGNTLGRRLIKDYSTYDFLESLIVSIRKPVKDFRTQEAVKLGYFPDLDTVDPESADYVEIGAITDEEATYGILQKGNILTITRKIIVNDDISLVTRAFSRFGRAARRTHGKYVWAMMIDNDNCTDGTAFFTVGHGNLGTSALTIATAYTAWKALAGMTEKDSGEYIGLLDGGLKPNLVGPTALLHLVQQVEKDEFYYSSNDLTTKTRNPLMDLVKGHTLSLLNGDANDWYMFLPATEVDIIEMGYLNGRQEPEVFVADAPTSEQMFVADEMRYKIRHEYAGTPVDCVGGYKGAVT